MASKVCSESLSSKAIVLREQSNLQTQSTLTIGLLWRDKVIYLQKVAFAIFLDLYLSLFFSFVLSYDEFDHACRLQLV